MATTLQIKRRVTGVAGAPTTLKTAELAWNMTDGYIYGGFGDDGSGNATSIKVLAKDDFAVAQRVPTGGSNGQVLTIDGSGNVVWGAPTASGPTYTGGTGITITGSTIAADTAVLATVSNLNLKANLAGPTFTGTVTVPTLSVTTGATAPTPTAGNNTTSIATTAFVTTAIAGKANLASPTFTGTPIVPTAPVGTNTTQAASTAYVRGEIGALLNGAGAAYDTLKELQDLIVNDASGLAALTTTVDGKLTKASNLSDLTNVATARTNLGLGSLATQSAASVTITGGSIDGVLLDGGTF